MLAFLHHNSFTNCLCARGHTGRLAESFPDYTREDERWSPLPSELLKLSDAPLPIAIRGKIQTLRIFQQTEALQAHNHIHNFQYISDSKL